MVRFVVYLLISLLLFLGIGACYGGGLLVIRPDGSLLGMNPAWLQNSPFSNYLIPGFVLLVFNGVLPLFAAFGLVFKPHWGWANLFNIYKNRHWAWTYSLYTGIIVIIWITVQLLLTQYFWLQPVMIFTGLAIIICSLTPGVMKEFEN